MRTIKNDTPFYEQWEKNAPVAVIGEGEVVRVATRDSYSDGYYSENQEPPVHAQPGYRTNPSSGPLFLTGAKAGDVIKIELLNIEWKESDPLPFQRVENAPALGEHATMVIRPGAGLLGDDVQELNIRILPIRQNRLLFNETLAIPLTPMVGLLAVAPAGEPIANAHPGEHGGNMDCARLVKGSSLYLKSQVEGGLISVGDVHAAMADGEVCNCGAESPAYVTLRASVVTGALPLPFLDCGDVVCTIVSRGTLDQAAQEATQRMHLFLTRQVGLAQYDSIRLLSLVGNLRICQCVGTYKTVRMELPRFVLDAYGYTLP